MDSASKLTLLAMVAGLRLPPQGVGDFCLENARIFRNPAIDQESGLFSNMGPNTTIYAGQERERHVVGHVATYLMELGIDAPNQRLGGTSIHGLGGMMMGATSGIETVTLTLGPNSSGRVTMPMGAVWDTPALMQYHVDRAALPLRLLTKARILVFPVAMVTNESRQELLNSGIKKVCPEPLGDNLQVELSADDCTPIREFSEKLAKINLAEFEIPISLFSRSFYKEDVADRALDLIVALESLLSGSSESVRYKIAFRASCLTTREEKDRWCKFRFAKKVYGYRSDLVHGNKGKLEKARIELSQKIEEIEDLVRSCLKLACLLEADQTKLPNGSTVSMRKEDLLDEYILTQCLATKGVSPVDSFPMVGKVQKYSRIL